MRVVFPLILICVFGFVVEAQGSEGSVISPSPAFLPVVHPEGEAPGPIHNGQSWRNTASSPSDPHGSVISPAPATLPMDPSSSQAPGLLHPNGTLLQPPVALPPSISASPPQKIKGIESSISPSPSTKSISPPNNSVPAPSTAERNFPPSLQPIPPQMKTPTVSPPISTPTAPAPVATPPGNLPKTSPISQPIDHGSLPPNVDNRNESKSHNPEPVSPGSFLHPSLASPPPSPSAKSLSPPYKAVPAPSTAERNFPPPMQPIPPQSKAPIVRPPISTPIAQAPVAIPPANFPKTSPTSQPIDHGSFPPSVDKRNESKSHNLEPVSPGSFLQPPVALQPPTSAPPPQKTKGSESSISPSPSQSTKPLSPPDKAVPAPSTSERIFPPPMRPIPPQRKAPAPVATPPGNLPKTSPISQPIEHGSLPPKVDKRNESRNHNLEPVSPAPVATPSTNEPKVSPISHSTNNGSFPPPQPISPAPVFNIPKHLPVNQSTEPRSLPPTVHRRNSSISHTLEPVSQAPVAEPPANFPKNSSVSQPSQHGSVPPNVHNTSIHKGHIHTPEPVMPPPISTFPVDPPLIHPVIPAAPPNEVPAPVIAPTLTPSSSNAFETGLLPNGDQMTQAAEISYKHPVHQMTVDVRITPVTNKSDTSLATQSSQQVLMTSSISHETDQHTNGGQMTHDAEICRQYLVQQMTVGVRNAPLTNKSDTSLVTQSSQQVLRTSSVARETDQLTNGGQMTRAAEVSRQYPVQQTTLDVWNTPLTNKSDTSLGTQSSQQILTMSSNAYETSPLTNGDQNTQTAETSRQYPVQQMTVGVRNAPLTNKSDTSLVTQSSQQVLRTSSIASETDQLTNGGQITQAAEVSRQYPVQQMALDVRNTPLTNNSDTLLATQSSQQVLRTSSIAHETGPLTSSDQMTSSIAHETGPQTNDDQMTQAAVVNCQCPVHQMTVGVRNTPLTNKSDTSLANQSSQQVLRTSSIAHETGPLTSGDQMTSSIAHETGPLANGDQMMQAAEVSRQYPPVHQMTVGVRDAPSTNKSDTSLATQSSQQVLGSSSNAYETNLLTNGGQMTQAAEISRQYPVHLGLHPSHNPVVGETPISMAPHLLKNQPGILNKDYPPSGVHIQTSEVSSAQVKTIGDNNSGKQGSDQGNDLSLETPSPCLSVGVTMPEEHLPSFPSTQKVQHQDCEEGSLSSSSCVPNYVNSYSNAIDLTCLHPSPVPKRVYCSERTPREQVEVLNQSSKSDDTHSSHFHVSGLLSDIKPVGPVTESGDNLHDGNLLDPDKKPTISPTPFPADDHTVDNGFANDQMNKPLLDTNSEMKLNLSEHMDPELKHVLASNEGVKEGETKDNHIKPFCDETETKNGKSDLPAVHHVSSVERLDVIASSLPEIDWGEAYRKESNDSHVVQELPVSVAGNITEVVSQDFPANVTNQVEGDILIDIDDRFPREMLSDMYSKAILEEDLSILQPPSTDGIGYSVNMENHEPKSWSYFGKLAQEGLDNVSPIDKDHLGFSHHVTPQTTDRVPADCENSHLNFGEENQDLHRRIETETHVLDSNYDQSQLNDTGSVQFDGRMENQRAPESEYEDGKFESENCNRSPHDSSLGEIAISTVQVIKNDDLEELRELGSGTFGTVYHGKWRGTDVAIKRIKKSCFRGSISEQERLTLEFWREADILSKLHHPNVVALYGVVQDGPGGTMATVTEFMVDGALKHVLLRKDKYLDHRKKLIIAMDAAFGMEYLHSKNIVHFDLKCDNLLVNLKDPLRPICKVGDFGLSKIKRNTLVTGGVRGTLPWMAPELLNGNSNKVSEKVDVFSFGIVLWEILTGEEPYANMHYGGIIGGIVNNTLRPAIPSYCDLEWKTLMEECWAPNPVARPSFTQIASRLRIMSAAATETKPQGNKPSK